MEPGLAEDDPTHELVEVDVVVEGEEGGEPHVAQDGDGVPQHQHQDHHRVEVQTTTCIQQIIGT